MSTFGFLFALSHCLPEAILTVGVLALILVGSIRERAEFIITELAVGVLGLALLSLFSGKANAVIFGGAFIDDGFGRFAKGLCYIGSIVTLLISHHFLVQEKINKFEFPVLVLLVDARNVVADFGEWPHRALSRPRTDVAGALCRRGVPSR